MTKELDFFKKLYLQRITGQTNKYWFTFYVPIGAAKQKSKSQFKPDAPILAYQKQ